ncbi:MAG: asparaginase [Clostridia bacterium]|nr:asparaginase [Clostridia bacterium]
MKRIRLIGTGGTIACVQTENGLAPRLGAAELLDYVDGDKSGVNCIDLFKMDSSNIQPEEWCRLAGKIYKTAWDYDAIVVTHGTDTMAYTASMLSFMLRGIRKPVVITGAQYPIVDADSDGRENLRDALTAARNLGGGVYICFGSQVMLGCRTVKTRTTSINAFESINYPVIARFTDGRFEALHTVEPPTAEPTLALSIDPRVALVKLIPGTSTSLLDNMPACGVRGLVVEAFGLGGVHNIRRDHTESLVKLMEQGLTVVLSSQCLYEPSSPDIYEVSRALRDAGIIPSYDMTTEATVTKLMWARGMSGDAREIRRLMKTNIANEMMTLSPEEIAR